MVIVQVAINESTEHIDINLLKREDATEWEWDSAKDIEQFLLELLQQWAQASGGELKVTRIDGPAKEQPQ